MNDPIQSSFDASISQTTSFSLPLLIGSPRTTMTPKIWSKKLLSYIWLNPKIHTLKIPGPIWLEFYQGSTETTYVLKSAPHFHPTRYLKSLHLQMMSPILSRMFFRQTYCRGSGKFSFCGIPLVCPLPKSPSVSISKNPAAARGTCGQRLI